MNCLNAPKNYEIDYVGADRDAAREIVYIGWPCARSSALGARISLRTPPQPEVMGAHLGRLEEARSEAEEFMKVIPNFSISEWARTEPYVDTNELQRYVNGLRRAGLPE